VTIDFVHVADYKGLELLPNTGRQLNWLDYSQKCNEYYQVKNYLLTDTGKLSVKVLQQFFLDPSIKRLRSFVSDYHAITEEHFDKEGDILLCDFATLYTLLINGVIPKYNHIVVMDCLELTVFLRDIYNPLGTEDYIAPGMHDGIVKILKELPCTFLATPYNKQDLESKGLKYVEYYRKINFDLFTRSYVDSLPMKNEMAFYYHPKNTEHPAWDVYLEEINKQCPDIVLLSNYMDVWEYQHVLYAPKPYVGFREQFGRMFFELEYFGRTCHIASVMNAEERTGMDFYLDHYLRRDDVSINLRDENFLKVVDNAIR
jgi:hypothetical protein